MLHSSLSMFNTERQDSWMMLYEQHLAEENSIEGKSELDHYLSDGNEPIVENFDILSWWKVNSSKYPILGQIAQDVLPIPVSTVASEFAFMLGIMSCIILRVHLRQKSLRLLFVHKIG